MNYRYSRPRSRSKLDQFFLRNRYGMRVRPRVIHHTHALSLNMRLELPLNLSIQYTQVHHAGRDETLGLGGGGKSITPGSAGSERGGEGDPMGKEIRFTEPGR